MSHPCLGRLLGSAWLFSGPLFTFSDDRSLTRQRLSSTVQSILHSAGYTGSYSGHSVRIGAATTAAARGVPDYLIQTLGRWSAGLGPRGLGFVAGLQVGRPVGVFPPWGVIAVAAPWPMGTQPPLAKRALNTIKSYLR